MPRQVDDNAVRLCRRFAKVGDGDGIPSAHAQEVYGRVDVVLAYSTDVLGSQGDKTEVIRYVTGQHETMRIVGGAETSAGAAFEGNPLRTYMDVVFAIRWVECPSGRIEH
jgi:hypothetical protein